jgi:tRNA A-37 threonylcarbamoyl transferase component Bud32
MDIINRTVIKEYEGVQINLITDSIGNKFIEKIKRDSNELEILESILKPLEIPHPRIIDSSKNEKSITIIMEFINGINCQDEPKAEYLYIAAEKIGEIYFKSKKNMARLDKSVVEKYTINKEVILHYIKVISMRYDMPSMDLLIDYIFEKYKNRTPFVNHGDMYFKNFIYNDDLHLIDWSSQISPFFTDLCALICQANEVDADIDEIKKRYCEFAQISSINDEDIEIAEIIVNIEEMHSFLVNYCPIEWVEGTYDGLQRLIQDFNYHKKT